MTGEPREIPSLSGTVAAGVAWRGGGQLLTLLGQFGITVLLARLLSPSDFGTAATALLIAGGVGLAVELGLPTILVQRPTLDEGTCAATRRLMLVVGSAVWLASIPSSSAAARFFTMPELAYFLPLSLLSLLIAPYTAIPTTLATRELRYKLLAAVETISAVAGGVGSLFFALGGLGPLSLILGNLLGSAVSLICWNRWRPWRASPEIARSSLGPLFPSSFRYLGAQLFYYIGGYLEQFVVARFLGAASLGAYSLAANLANAPHRRITSIVTGAGLPALARIQEERGRLVEAFRKLQRHVGHLTFPLLFGLAATAHLIVPLLYGDRWRESITPLQLLALAGALYSPATVAGTLILATGGTGTLLLFGAIRLLSVGGLLMLGIRAGLPGVAAAVLAYSFLYFLLAHYCCGRAAGTPVGAVLSPLWPPFAASAVMIGAVLGVQSLVSAFPSAIQLLASVVLGGVGYGGTLKLLFPADLAEFLEIAGRAWRRNRP